MNFFLLNRNFVLILVYGCFFFFYLLNSVFVFLVNWFWVCEVFFNVFDFLRVSLWISLFCFIVVCDWFKIFVLCFYFIKGFFVYSVGCLFLFCVVIGLFECLCLLWLDKVNLVWYLIDSWKNFVLCFSLSYLF